MIGAPSIGPDGKKDFAHTMCMMCALTLYFAINVGTSFVYRVHVNKCDEFYDFLIMDE